MSNTHCELLVVDACIARSSGDFNASAEDAKVCRDVLLCIYHSNHKLVWTPAIRGEWLIHSSNFAREWRTNMARAGKIHPVIPHPVNAGIWQRIINIPLLGEHSITIMKKDFIYIEAAIKSDKCILFRDDEARSEFSQASMVVDDINQIIWINPCNRQERIFDWFQNGAIYEHDRTLGLFHESNS